MEVSSSINHILESIVVRKGAWCEEEDLLLRRYIGENGEGKWRQVPLKAGLKRCGKSCRLRWCNYLKPNIKKGEFEPDERDLIMRMHKLLGNRWSIIAGRLPGRTANDIKNYYHTHLKKKQVVTIKKLLRGQTNNGNTSTATDGCNGNRKMTKVSKPLPQRFANESQTIANKTSSSTGMNNNNINIMGTIIPSINFGGDQGVQGGGDDYWNDLWGALGKEVDQH